MGQKTKKWAILTVAVVWGWGSMTMPQVVDANTAVSGTDSNPNGAKASVNYGTAVGDRASANSGTGSTAIGYSASATASWAVVVGYSSTVALQATAVGSQSNASQFSTAMGHKASAGAQYSTALGMLSGASAYCSTAVGYGSRANSRYSVAFGSSSVASEENVFSVGGGYYVSSNGDTKVMYRRIVNVAAGTADTDAVNYGQLKSYVAEQIGSSSGSISPSELAGTGLVVKNDKLAVDTSGAIAENNNGIVTGGAIWQYIKENAGSGSSAAIGDTEKLSDAGLGDNVTDSILSVNDKVGNLSDDINKVGAGAAALAALRPEAFDPNDKWSFAVGYGHYKNANAGAIGAFFKPNADTTVSIGGTIGNGDPMMNAGVSFKLGNRGKKSGTYRNVRDVVARVDALEATDARHESLIAAQQKEIAAQAQEIRELKAQVAALMQHAGLSASVAKTVAL